jgi:hypothetical protein
MAFEDLAYNENLQIAIKASYPGTYKLMKYNAKGTIKLLQACKVFNAKKVRKKIGTGHKDTGSDSVKAWADYKPAVLKYFEGINPDCRLAPAREKMTNKIYHQHYTKFPRWPPSGQKQSGMVNITDKDGYEIEIDGGQFFVSWSCEGDLTVTDNREDGNYSAEFEGKPTLKILYVDFIELKRFEQLAISNEPQAKKMADKYQVKALKWDDIDED